MFHAYLVGVTTQWNKCFKSCHTTVCILYLNFKPILSAAFIHISAHNSSFLHRVVIMWDNLTTTLENNGFLLKDASILPQWAVPMVGQVMNIAYFCPIVFLGKLVRKVCWCCEMHCVVRTKNCAHFRQHLGVSRCCRNRQSLYGCA